MDDQNISHENKSKDIFAILRYSSEYSLVEWKFADYTKGHLIMMLTIMIIAYILQLAGFIFILTQIDIDDIPDKNTLVINEPYFECIEISLMLLLTHFNIMHFMKTQYAY